MAAPGSDTFQLVVVIRRVRRLLLVQEEQRGLVRPVLHWARVSHQVCDGGGAGGSGLLQPSGVVVVLRGLRRAVQKRRHQAVLVLSPRDLRNQTEQ